jgi:hypothetical protein
MDYKHMTDTELVSVAADTYFSFENLPIDLIREMKIRFPKFNEKDWEINHAS